MRDDVERVGRTPGFGGVPAPLLARGMTTWAILDEWFEFQARGMARRPGIA